MTSTTTTWDATTNTLTVVTVSDGAAGCPGRTVVTVEESSLATTTTTAIYNDGSFYPVVFVDVDYARCSGFSA